MLLTWEEPEKLNSFIQKCRQGNAYSVKNGELRMLDDIDIVSWLRDHTEESAAFINDRIYFESEEDYVYFILKWT